MLYAFLDTTALHKSYMLRGGHWPVVERGIEQSLLRVATSDVVVMELERQAMREVSDVNTSLRSAASAAARLGEDLEVSLLNVPAQWWRLQFESRLRHLGIEVVPHPQVAHEEIIRRDLAGTPPFKASGEGYRDTLIWMTFLGWIQSLDLNPTDEVRFVSANTRQFGGNDKRLAEILARELPAGVNVVLVTDRSAVVEHLRPLLRAPEPEPSDALPTPGDIAEHVAGLALANLYSTPLEHLDGLQIGDLHVDVDESVPALTSAAIDWIDEANASTDANLVDILDDTTELWDVVVEAVVHLDADLDAPDLEDLATAEVRRINWDAQYVSAYLPVVMRLRYNVRVERQGQHGYAELVEAALRPYTAYDQA